MKRTITLTEKTKPEELILAESAVILHTTMITRKVWRMINFLEKMGTEVLWESGIDFRAKQPSC